jgi:beta-lactam-binding protein with PASTA domain
MNATSSPVNECRTRAIFISYRREDSEGEAGRLFDDLVEVFGQESVFMDVAAIEVGRDFRKAIDDSVATCGVLLAVIGKGWIDAKNAAGQRRLDDISDFVRLETASALKRDIPVVPVLVRGATMPRPEELPDDLKELAYRNGVELTHPRWSSDVQILVNALRPLVGTPSQPSTAQGPIPTGTVPGTKSAVPVTPVNAADTHTAISTPLPKKSVGKVIGIAAGALLLLIVGLVSLSSKNVTVPDVSGNTLADAKTKLETQHLVVGTKTLREDPSADPNTVIGQNPAANASVKSGSTVDLVLSRASSVEVPPLVGESLEDARRSLADRQLTVGTVERKPKAGVDPNTVLQEFPIAGEKVKGGSNVDLMVAEAPGTANAGSGIASEGKPAKQRQAEKTVYTNDQNYVPPAGRSANQTTQAAATTPEEPAPPREPVINLTGYWHDTSGVTYQTVQRGNTFTYSASGVGGLSRGAGTIRGLQFESTYSAAYVNGARSTGRCTGTISPEGNEIRGTCFDSLQGQTFNILSR